MPTDKHSKQSRQSGQYDKVIKEHLEITLPVIISDVLGLNIVESEELPDDLQHTKERRPDVLKKVTDALGNTYILHLEFQVKDDREMVIRMADYYIMLIWRYGLPVKQYVIYLGEPEPTMLTHLDTEQLNFNFNLVSISQANYTLFLKSDNPEVKMLGILGDFGGKDSFAVVKEIVESVKSHATGDFAESRYFKQLRIFVQLRSNIGQQFEKAMETITKFFKEEKDYLYRKGEAKGIEKGIEKGTEKKSYDVVENLITELGLTDDQIARIAEVSTDFIQKIRTDLDKKKK